MKKKKLIRTANVAINSATHKRLLGYCDRTGLWMRRVLDDAVNQHIERMEKTTG